MKKNKPELTPEEAGLGAKVDEVIRKENEELEAQKFAELANKYGIKKGADYWRDISRALANEYVPAFKGKGKGAPVKWHPIAQALVVSEMECLMTPEKGKKIPTKTAARELMKKESWIRFMAGNEDAEGALVKAYQKYKKIGYINNLRGLRGHFADKGEIVGWEQSIDVMLSVSTKTLGEVFRRTNIMNKLRKN